MHVLLDRFDFFRGFDVQLAVVIHRCVSVHVLMARTYCIGCARDERAFNGISRVSLLYPIVTAFLLGTTRICARRSPAVAIEQMAQPSLKHLSQLYWLQRLRYVADNRPVAPRDSFSVRVVARGHLE